MGSKAGQDTVRKALSRRRLPGALDVDIEEAVLGEAYRYLQRGGTIDSPAGWCRARIAARAVDLSRGVIRTERHWGKRVDAGLLEREDSSMDSDEQAPDQMDGPTYVEGDDWSLDGQGHDLDNARRGLISLRDDDIATAGALTFAAIVGEQAKPLEVCPQPTAGASPAEAAMWGVLWYLGIRDCFGPGNTAAKRRSRASAKVRRLLRDWGESA